MKKILIASAAAALMTVSGAALAQQNVFATTDLNVRAGPGTSYRVVGTLGPDDPATILNCAQGSNWCHIAYGGGEGWASARYLADAGGYGYERRGAGGAVAAGAATGAIGGALIGGPVGAAIGGIAGGAIGAGMDAASDGARRGAGTATGLATGAVAGALIGGPVGAVVGGVAGGAIGAGTEAAVDGRGVDRTMTGSIVPDRVPLSAIPGEGGDQQPELSYVFYAGYPLMVETATGKVVSVLR